jgi:phosphatidylserine/phosphatidylglycerophosphate/cardiolipin synthase-like enzyme
MPPASHTTFRVATGEVSVAQPSPAARPMPRQAQPQRPGSIAEPGRNCWKVARAKRAAVLVDGAAYFAALEAALRKARRSVVILGWDFDGRIRLRQDADEADSPPLGALLRSQVEANPELEVNILVWSESILHTPGSTKEMLFGADWQDHPRITVKLDTYHPIYAAHHQKIVTIDDCLAFSGGMDLTVARWDRSPHQVEDPARIDPDGKAYQPVHDVQMLVDGDAACALSEVAKDRWRNATGGGAPLDCTCPTDFWPDGLTPDFTDVDVAIARTLPEYEDTLPVREAMRLTIDAIESARDTIYIEAQYMTSGLLGEVLERRLKAAGGPEIVVVMAHECNGIVERLVMGTNRDRLIRRLRKADRHGRMRILYPCIAQGTAFTQVFVHAKVLAVDDRYLRVGSSNLNNRSIGLDTECDVAVEASDEAARKAVAGVRDRLLAEHLGVHPARFTDARERTGSLIAAIDELNGVAPQRLRPFAAMYDDGPDHPVAGTWLLDPSRPFKVLRLWDRFWRKLRKGR